MVDGVYRGRGGDKSVVLRGTRDERPEETVFQINGPILSIGRYHKNHIGLYNL